MVHLEMVLECACKSYEGTFMDQTTIQPLYENCSESLTEAFMRAAGKKGQGKWGRGVLGYGDIYKEKPAQYSAQVLL